MLRFLTSYNLSALIFYKSLFYFLNQNTFFAFLFAISFFNTNVNAQTGEIYGILTNEEEKPIQGVQIYLADNPNKGTLSSQSGRYQLNIPANLNVKIVFTYLGYKSDTTSILLIPNQKLEINKTLVSGLLELKEVEIKDDPLRENAGSVKINVENISNIPTPLGGVEAALVTQGLGVSSTNELSSTYSVRGGNYDENLIYVNDFEIYRPFLIRSGQGEGLSFINPDLVSNVEFSSGGFQAKYGDKMSSVLDVGYKKPKQFGGSIAASFLGVNAHLEGADKNERFTFLTGFRQRSNQYLVNSLETKGQFVPLFIDWQAYATYKVNDKNEIEWITNYARNKFAFIPEELTTTFGAVNQVFQLRMSFEGSENDRYRTYMNGFSWTTKVNPHLKLKWLSSIYSAQEDEAFDILGDFFIGEVETDFSSDDFGQTSFALGTGALHRFARNRLETLVANFEHRGTYIKNNRTLQWGLKYQREKIDDQLREWVLLDSAGFSLPFFQNNNDVLELDNLLRSNFNLNSNRYSGFVQENIRFGEHNNFTLNYGIRFSYWDVNKEFLVSPRIQFSWKPLNLARNVIFRASAGMYQQPPFYREMRNLQGQVNLNLDAQKSVHIIAGTDINFKAWNRDFKFISEVYYKYLYDQVPYEFDNVLIRYFGENRSTGYAAGLDFSLHGEFVKGTDSYITMSIMSSKEDLKDDVGFNFFDEEGKLISPASPNVARIDTFSPGSVARPTDQRVKFAMYFEDYLPRNENFKVHLNLIVSTGLPFGPPDGERFRDVLRLPTYRRMDIGFSAQLFEKGKKEFKKKKPFTRHLKSIWLTAEIWNLLGVQNTISFLWVKDLNNTVWAVPNRLTARRLNLRLVVKF